MVRKQAFFKVLFFTESKTKLRKCLINRFLRCVNLYIQAKFCKMLLRLLRYLKFFEPLTPHDATGRDLVWKELKKSLVDLTFPWLDFWNMRKRQSGFFFSASFQIWIVRNQSRHGFFFRYKNQNKFIIKSNVLYKVIGLESKHGWTNGKAISLRDS